MANQIAFYPRTSSPLATSSTPGIVQPDNTTITVDGSGVISAVGGANTAFTNVANTFTANQTIESGSPEIVLNDTDFFHTLMNIGLSGGNGFILIPLVNMGITLNGNTKAIQLGTGANGDASAVVQGGFFCPSVGAQLTAAATIAPTSSVHHITGATAVVTITVPSHVVAGWRLSLIADSAGTWTTGGNIALAGSFTLHQAQDFIYDGTSFYPVL